ncbi:acyltransferase domain-containing protein, partial [Streptomyces sp. NPDC058103]|uniref:acyltransferase domain-containing protein n=1 Tax=Streptomyces sp. NPDC058103 TaxID=3346341 RepID=UPI0036E36E31
MFPGQGSQWVGMGRRLLEESSVFAGRMAECDEVIGGLVGWSVVEVLRGGGEGLGRIEVVQPVLFAVMVSLAAVWESVGVRPDVVVGHSQGEVAAACVAGVLSLEDAVRVVVLRSELFARRLVGGGAVASVGLSAGEVGERLVGFPGLGVAGRNGPGGCSVAGEVGVLERFVEVCVGEGVRARVLESTVASHGVQVEPLREELLGLLEGVVPGVGVVPFCSTVFPGVVEGERLDAEYWYDNARRMVDFHGAVDALLAEGNRFFVEVSPHPVLAGAVARIAEDNDVSIAGLVSLRRGDDSYRRMLTSVAEGFVQG